MEFPHCGDQVPQFFTVVDVLLPVGGEYEVAARHKIEIAKDTGSLLCDLDILKDRIDDGVSGYPDLLLVDAFLEKVAPIIKLALADGLAAMAHVRTHAKDYGVHPDRIGVMGFSAGGIVAASVAYNYTAETRPDFVAPIYLAHDLVIQGDGVRGDAPPLFVVAATDDHFGLAPQSVAIYQAWVAAKKPAELHLYAKGGHGFGMNKQDLPCDTWADRFADWLQMPGLLEK